MRYLFQSLNNKKTLIASIDCFNALIRWIARDSTKKFRLKNRIYCMHRCQWIERSLLNVQRDYSDGIYSRSNCEQNFSIDETILHINDIRNYKWKIMWHLKQMLFQKVKQNNDRNDSKIILQGGKIYTRAAIHRLSRCERVSHLLCSRNDATNRRTLRRSE